MIEEAGYECDVFPAEPKRARQASWEKQQERLANWIDGLPKPVGIMAANDERGLMVLDACRRHNRRVPEEVAVIGVDINPDNNRKDVLTVGFNNWAVKEGPMASAEFNGIKVTLRKVGSQGTGLAIGWWKGGLDYGVTMANDGAYVKDGNRGGQRLV